MKNLKQVPSEAQIRKFIRRIVFGKNLFCPECRSRKVFMYENRYRCKTCCIKFSLTSHTWLSSMRLDLETWWTILWCWTCQIPVRQTCVLTSKPEKTVRHWFGVFRAHLPEESHILERIVQLDEAFFTNRFLIMGKQVGTRKLAYDVVSERHPQRHHAAYFLFRKVKPGSSLWTDGAGIYQGIDRWWPVEHTSDRHAKFEFAHTSEIEGMFGVYRTFVRRMYHHHWSENLEQYVREFCFRFSSPEIFNSPLNYLEKTLILVPIR